LYRLWGLAQVGLLHVCSFILLLLSGDRNFAVALNKPFVQSLTLDLPSFQGSYAEFLILTYYRLITNSHPSILNLVDCMLTTIANISPYVKSLSLVTCTKLLNLFYIYGSPTYLASHDTSINLVILLLEIYNNLIQYQFQGSVHLVYGIIRRPQAFHELRDLNLEMIESKLSGSTSSLPKAGDIKPPIDVDIPEEPKIDEHDKNIIDLPPPPNANSNPYPHINEAWIQKVKEKLPLETILRLIEALLQQIEKLYNEDGITDEHQIIQCLREITLVGLLPIPHPILVRRYQSSEAIISWFTGYIWGIIFLRNSFNLPIWSASTITLFQIKIPL
jgi:hypothetical protein